MPAAEELTPLGVEDARILALETGPIRGHTLKVLVVDDAPAADPVAALRSAMEGRLADVPRWRQRLVSAPGTETGLAWQDDPAFDIAHQVRAARVGGAVDEEGLRRVVAESMVSSLDRDRPLWSVDVVPLLTDGRWALVWKVHHALADGVTTMRAGARLLWTEAPVPRRAAPPRPAPPSAPAQLATGARLAALTSHRGLVIREFRRVRHLSPLARDVGSDRTVAFARCTVDELRTLGKAVAPEVTVNDVLLAVVAGALRGWLVARDAPARTMKAQVPVSMHPRLDTEEQSGNRDSFLFVRLPLAEPDPVERVRAVARATRLRKNRHDAGAIYALRQSLSHAPGPLRRALQRSVQGPHEYSLNISNVPGPAGPIHVLDRRVDELYSVAEVARYHALRVAAISLGGRLYVGLCADPLVVPDLDALAVGLRAEVDALHERLGL